MTESLLAPNELFDLYSHSGSGIMAKNLLNDADFSRKVHNAVFLNPAGTTTMHARFPAFFRTMAKIQGIVGLLKDLPHVFRAHYEIDKGEAARTPANRFRDRVTVAIQDGSHYRQPGWDTMKVNTGRIVLYVGGKDVTVGGRQFARYIQSRLHEKTDSSPITLEYDKRGHHLTPFTHPELVFDRIMKNFDAGEK